MIFIQAEYEKKNNVKHMIFQAPRDKVITLELKMLNFGSVSCEEESIIIYEGHSTRKYVNAF
jgi:hypothetical protein